MIHGALELVFVMIFQILERKKLRLQGQNMDISFRRLILFTAHSEEMSSGFKNPFLVFLVPMVISTLNRAILRFMVKKVKCQN